MLGGIGFRLMFALQQWRCDCKVSWKCPSYMHFHGLIIVSIGLLLVSRCTFVVVASGKFGL